MSYDLFFRGARLTDSEFLAYFSGRPHYQMGPKQAVHENEDTGVHFGFDFGAFRVSCLDGRDCPG